MAGITPCVRFLLALFPKGRAWALSLGEAAGQAQLLLPLQ